MTTQPKPRIRPGDPSSDVARFRRDSLEMFFAPRAVAVIGASDKPRSVGRTVLRNLLETPFGGAVYPIHPQSAQVLGIKAYPNVAAAPEPIDLAIIATPAVTAPDMVKECAAAGVGGAIIISAGFREIGAEGLALEQKILENARRVATERVATEPGSVVTRSLRILGPNCLGVMRPFQGLNATFASNLPRKGGIGFVSQSGALGTAVLDWSIRENFGFSAFISVGSMLDLGWGELIDYLGADEHTQSIVLYMETVGDARAFLSAARQVALDKPIIILKAGRSEQGARAAARHTGAAIESDAVLDAAFRRAGALRVDTIADLFHIAEVLAKQPRPKGPQLAILTNAGGPGVLATDSLYKYGGALAHLTDETIAQLDSFLPLHWSHSNPVDILGDAEPALYAKSLDVLSHDSNTNGVLVVLTPQAMTDPTASAEAIKPFAQMRSKPLLAAWMGGAEVEVGANALRAAGVPVFSYPDHAVRMFDYLWRYSQNLRALYETPMPAAPEIDDGARVRVRAIIDRARAAGRTLLTENESQEILAVYGIPFIETHLVTTATQAVHAADALGYPVVMKLNTDRIVRKREYGGVILNITSANNVRATFRAVKNTVTNLLGKENFRGVLLQPMLNLKGGYALHLGSMLDPQFGPVLRFGAEKRPPPTDTQGAPVGSDPTTKVMLDARYRDDALGLPPLNTTLARRMMEHTRVYKILREANVDTTALEQVLARFAQLVAEQGWIKAIDIHPLMVLPPFDRESGGATRVVGLDARILLHDPAFKETELPRPSIRPYPTQYVEPFNLKDGTPVTIRPIRSEDEPLLIHFHEKLSEQSVYLRYFHALNLSQRIAHERLARIATNDYDREIALVVERAAPGQAEGELLAVARLTKIQNTGDAEFA
ncbi:MAG: acetate--CoA ligase family protein, partial [Chloroflexi bacterium]|nr:acetate--CoA ligase family protein [Chloroflexota bacterium]